MMKGISLSQIGVVLAVIATLLVNGLANALPLNGQTTAEISDRFDVLFVPAGYVFSIWGLVYIALIAFGIYQALPAQRSNERLERIRGLFLVSSAANIGWLFAWHYEFFPLSMLAMLTLLISLAAVYHKLNIGLRDSLGVERWCVDVPFSLYLAWISVATIANAADVLDFAGWGGWGIDPAVWAVIMLLISGGLALFMALTRGDAVFVLVVMWALLGIGIKQFEAPLVSISSFAIGVALGVALAVTGLRRIQAGRSAALGE
jgi:hypothetical protein